MDKAIVTIFLLIAGIVCSLVIFNAMYPAINRSSAAISTMSSNVDDRIKSQIEIIQTVNQDSNIYIWVKNVGSSRIETIEKCDVFFGETGNFSRITYGGAETPRWDYIIEGNDTEWGPTATIKITIYLSGAPSSGTYFIKIIIPNGISDEHEFSI
jgi:flagellar protein FlaG